MEKQVITFKADEQGLIKTGGITNYASNTVSYIEATFILGANWSGFDSVRAIWSNDYRKAFATVLDSDGKCIVPAEVLARTGNVKVNLVGSIASGGELTDRLTTYPILAVIVDANARVEGDETKPVTPTQFEQFVEIVHDEVEQVTGMTAEAETLPAGSDATASYNDGVLSLGIPKGADGVDGQDGVTPDIDIGTVETLETGVPAYANITGTVENPSLNLGLPKGNTGDTGATGAPAGFGAVTATIDGTTGTPSVDVTASGADTAKNFAFAFHNLKGEQGEQGEQGDPGVVQDVTVNGTSVVDQNGVAVITMPELVKTVQGNPIVVDDAWGTVKNLDVELLPIQDLNGYSKPWAGGAGTNKFDEVTEYGRIDFNTGQDLPYAGTRSKNYVPVVPSTSYYIKTPDNLYVIEYDANQDYIRYKSYFNNSVYTSSADAYYIRFYLIIEDATGIAINYPSTVTTYSPYANICPITGHSSVSVRDTGKNLLDIASVTLKKWRLNSNTFYTVADSSSNIVVSVTDDTVSCQTTVAYYGFGFEIGAVDYARTVSVTNYGTAGVSSVSLFSSYTDGATGVLNGRTITIPANRSGFVAFRVDGARTFTTQIQVEYGNTATTYAPYHGQSKTVTLPHTVYGAGVGVTSGESKETWHIETLTGEETYDDRWFPAVICNKTVPKGLNSTDIICNYTNKVIFSNSYYNTFQFSNANTEWGVSSGAEFKALAQSYYQAGTPITVCYKLATPLDLSTTPTSLSLYNGDNVVSSDGDMTMDYVQDMAIVIRKIENQL